MTAPPPLPPATLATARPPPTPWCVQCDFDGTISLVDVTDSLLARFARDGWQALEAEWEAGRIGSLECMQAQVALLDMDAAELDAHLQTIELDAGFAGFVAAAEARGCAVQVVSDGLDRVIRHLLARHGLGRLEVIANRLVQAGPRAWRMEAPWSSTGCLRASANCKCERLAAQHALARRVLYVGDGHSDFCVSARADFVLAKHKLIAHCRAEGIAFAPFNGFAQAQGLLAQVLDAPAPAASPGAAAAMRPPQPPPAATAA